MISKHFVELVFTPYPGYSAVESQEASGTPDQDTGGGRGGRKEGEGSQEPGSPTQVSQKQIRMEQNKRQRDKVEHALIPWLKQ